MAVHMGRLVVSGLFGPCKINVYKKKMHARIKRQYIAGNCFSSSLHLFLLSAELALASNVLHENSE